MGVISGYMLLEAMGLTRLPKESVIGRKRVKKHSGPANSQRSRRGDASKEPQEPSPFVSGEKLVKENETIEQLFYQYEELENGGLLKDFTQGSDMEVCTL